MVFRINEPDMLMKLIMRKYFRAIFISLLCAFFAHITYAQTTPSATLRPLVSPDLTGFHQPLSLARTGTLIDEKRGWIYFYGATHINGVVVNGLFRTNLKGQVDYTWLPKKILITRYVALAENGDLIQVASVESGPFSTIDFTNSTALRLARISHTTGAAIVAQTTIPNAGNERSVPYLSSLAITENLLYFVVREEFASSLGRSEYRTNLRRFNLSTLVVDPAWTRELGNGAGIIKAASNAIYVSEIVDVRVSQSAPPEQRAKIQRISVATTEPAWSTTLGAGFRAAQVDSAGRVYLLRDGIESAPTVFSVQRLTTEGEVDSDWSTRLEGIAITNSASRSSGWLIDDRFVVLLENKTFEPTLLTQTLLSFNSRGTLITSRILDPGRGDQLGSSFVGGEKQLYILGDQSISPLNAVTLQPTATFTGIAVGYTTSPTNFMPQADGSLIVTGSFSVWYEGEEYRNYVRFKANGLPDLSQRIDAEIAKRFCAPGLRTKAEVHLYYSCATSDRGSEIFYLFDPSRNISRVFDLKSLSTDPVIAFSLAADGWLYFLSYVSESSFYVRRVNVTSGAVDTNWSFVFNGTKPLSDFGGYIASLDIDEKGGMWIGFAATDCFTGQCGVFELLRYALSDPAAPPELVAASGFDNSVYTLRLTKTHAYVSSARYLLGKTLLKDRSFGSIFPPIFVDDQYEYSLSIEETSDISTRARKLSRRPVASDAAPDKILRLTTGGSVEAIWTQPTGELNALVSVKPDFYSGAVATVFSEAKDIDTRQTVIEYFSPVANRYFITGRLEEQTLLDSYPQLYSRTGMRFMTTSSKFRDADAQPVCRFYSAPARGGSNSHFLGTGSDCAVVNAFKGFVYEGYDFGAVLPVAGVCPAAYPVAITRMFNNQGATAQGNHRYATNAAIVTQMSARGWANEGVVFCAISATDPVN